MTRRIQTFPVHFVMTWCLVTAIVLLRSWQDIVFPALLFEDRHFLLPLYFNEHRLVDIFSDHLDYASVGPQLAAWLLALLPLDSIPFGYATVSLLLCTLAFSLFALPRFASLCPDPLHRMLLCLLLAILPLGRSLLVTNLTYSEFNILFILILLVASVNDRHSHPAVNWLLVPLCILSHPLSVTLIPMYLLNMLYATREQRLQQGFFIAVTVFYVYYLVDRSASELLTPDYLLLRAVIAFVVYGARVMVEPWTGAIASVGMFDGNNILSFEDVYIRHITLAATVLLLSASILLLLRLWQRHHRQASVYSILLTGFGTLYVSVLTRLTGLGWSAHLLEPHLQRYTYNARLCLLVFLGCLLSSAIQRHPQLQLRIPATILVLLAFTAAIYSNSSNAILYDPAIKSAGQLMAFLQNVQHELDNGNKTCILQHDCIRRFEADGRWPVILDLNGK